MPKITGDIVLSQKAQDYLISSGGTLRSDIAITKFGLTKQEQLQILRALVTIKREVIFKKEFADWLIANYDWLTEED